MGGKDIEGAFVPASPVIVAAQLLSSVLYGVSALDPLTYVIVPSTLIFVGLRWSKWRDSIRLTVLARMPTTARDFVTRLAPGA